MKAHRVHTFVSIAISLTKWRNIPRETSNTANRFLLPTNYVAHEHEITTKWPERNPVASPISSQTFVFRVRRINTVVVRAAASLRQKFVARCTARTWLPVIRSCDFSDNFPRTCNRCRLGDSAALFTWRQWTATVSQIPIGRKPFLVLRLLKCRRVAAVIVSVACRFH